MVKFRIFLIVVFCGLLLSSVVVPGNSSFGISPQIVAADSYDTSGSLMYFESCQVTTQGGNLNVRNLNGAIIGKLPNGTWVRIIEEALIDNRALVSATVGRRTIRGYVSTDFLSNCH